MTSELSTPAGTAAKPDMLDTFQEQLFPAFQVVLQVRTAMTLRCVVADTFQNPYLENCQQATCLACLHAAVSIGSPNAAAISFWQHD